MPTIGTYCQRDRFLRAQTLTTTPAGELGWTKKITESTSQSTSLCVSGNGLELTLGAANESKVLTAYQNDVLPYLLNKVKRVSFTLALSGIDANTMLAVGLASAQNDTLDSVATHVWFRCEGASGAILAECDDGVTDTDDKSTGKTLGTTLKKCMIDFSKGLGDIRLTVDGEPVATGVTFSMSGAGATDKVQLFAQLQKASGTGTCKLTIRDVEIETAVNDG